LYNKDVFKPHSISHNRAGFFVFWGGKYSQRNEQSGEEKNEKVVKATPKKTYKT